MYTCGPTVYDYAHIGNFRTFVFQDILRRYLKHRGLKLTHVMNLTDVDDRIIANAAAAGVGIREYTEKYAQAFFADCQGVERGSAGTLDSRDGSYSRHGAADRTAAEKDVYLRQRRIDLLPDCEISGVRETFQD